MLLLSQPSFLLVPQLLLNQLQLFLHLGNSFSQASLLILTISLLRYSAANGRFISINASSKIDSVNNMGATVTQITSNAL